jgi:hypothetical protein
VRARLSPVIHRHMDTRLVTTFGAVAMNVVVVLECRLKACLVSLLVFDY